MSSLCPLWLLSSSCVSLLFSSFSARRDCIFAESVFFRSSLQDNIELGIRTVWQIARNNEILTFPGTDSLSFEFLCKAALWTHSDLHGTWNFHPVVYSAKHSDKQSCYSTQAMKTKVIFSTSVKDKTRLTIARLHWDVQERSSHLVLHLLLGALELFQQCLGVILLLHQTLLLFCQLFKSRSSFARSLWSLKCAKHK